MARKALWNGYERVRNSADRVTSSASKANTSIARLAEERSTSPAIALSEQIVALVST